MKNDATDFEIRAALFFLFFLLHGLEFSSSQLKGTLAERSDTILWPFGLRDGPSKVSATLLPYLPRVRHLRAERRNSLPLCLSGRWMESLWRTTEGWLWFRPRGDSQGELRQTGIWDPTFPLSSESECATPTESRELLLVQEATTYQVVFIATQLFNVSHHISGTNKVKFESKFCKIISQPLLLHVSLSLLCMNTFFIPSPLSWCLLRLMSPVLVPIHPTCILQVLLNTGHKNVLLLPVRHAWVTCANTNTQLPAQLPAQLTIG